MINKVTPSDISIESFKVKNELCSKIWDDDVLDDKIRLHLLKIAKDFYTKLAISWVKVHDVILTGSLANYNWSTYSDFDVHIVINYDDVDEDYEMVSEYLSNVKTNWNNEHEIKIKDFDVELYVQDKKETHNSTGIYSLIKNEWVIKPVLLEESFDKNIVKNKIALILNKVDYYQELLSNGDFENSGKLSINLWDKIKLMRINSLNLNGEMSNGNIIFKGLRRLGYIERINDIIIQSYDNTASIT